MAFKSLFRAYLATEQPRPLADERTVREAREAWPSPKRRHDKDTSVGEPPFRNPRTRLGGRPGLCQVANRSSLPSTTKYIHSSCYGNSALKHAVSYQHIKQKLHVRERDHLSTRILLHSRSQFFQAWNESNAPASETIGWLWMKMVKTRRRKDKEIGRKIAMAKEIKNVKHIIHRESFISRAFCHYSFYSLYFLW